MFRTSRACPVSPVSARVGGLTPQAPLPDPATVTTSVVYSSPLAGRDLVVQNGGQAAAN
nr:hypothetical protein [Micromonospora sp. DSM 115978]